MRSIHNGLRRDYTFLDELLLSAGVNRVSIKSRIGAFAFSSIFFLAGLAVLYGATIRPLAQYLDSGNWQQTAASVTESKLDWDDDSARVEIHYKYRINGTDYSGKRYGWDNGRQNFGIEAMKKTVERHPTGSAVGIWFDPDQPTESIIDRSHTGITGANLFFPIPFLLIGICGISYALFGGVAAARTRELLDTIAQDAESKGLASLAGQLRNPSNTKDSSRRLVFSMAQSRIEALGILFAAVFWNGIVAVFVSLLIGFIISGDGQALFLGLFLIPFVLIGIFLITATANRFRAPRPPAYLFAFSGLRLTTVELEIPLSWMRLEQSAKSPDARNIRLHIGRDIASKAFSFGKKPDLPSDDHTDSIPLDANQGEVTYLLEAAPVDPKRKSWKPLTVSDISAVFSWEEEPRREKRSVTWSLIAPESND